MRTHLNVDTALIPRFNMAKVSRTTFICAVLLLSCATCSVSDPTTSLAVSISISRLANAVPGTTLKAQSLTDPRVRQLNLFHGWNKIRLGRMQLRGGGASLSLPSKKSGSDTLLEVEAEGCAVSEQESPEPQAQGSAVETTNLDELIQASLVEQIAKLMLFSHNDSKKTEEKDKMDSGKRLTLPQPQPSRSSSALRDLEPAPPQPLLPLRAFRAKRGGQQPNSSTKRVDDDDEDEFCKLLLSFCSASDVAAGFRSGPPVPACVPSGFVQGTNAFSLFRKGFLPFVLEAARAEAQSAFQDAVAGKCAQAKTEGGGPGPGGQEFNLKEELPVAEVVVRARVKRGEEAHVHLEEVEGFGGAVLPKGERVLSGCDILLLLPPHASSHHASSHASSQASSHHASSRASSRASSHHASSRSGASSSSSSRRGSKRGAAALDLSEGAVLLVMSGRSKGIAPASLSAPDYNGNAVAELLRSTARPGPARPGARTGTGRRFQVVELRAIRFTNIFLRHVSYTALSKADLGLRKGSPIVGAFAGAASGREGGEGVPPATRSNLNELLLPHSEQLRMLSDAEQRSVDPSLHPSQLLVVQAAATLKRGVLVVWGPPGTGKTKTLVSVVYDQYLLHCKSDPRSENQVGCFAPTNRASRELCQRFVGARGEQVGLAKVLLVRSQKAELGASPTDLEFLLPVDMHARLRRVRQWFDSPALHRVGSILRRDGQRSFLNAMQRDVAGCMAGVKAGRSWLPKPELAKLYADRKLFKDGKLFEILHRELESGLETLRKETGDIEGDVRGASRDGTCREIDSLRQRLDGAVSCLGAVLACFKRLASERHRQAERGTQGDAFQDKASREILRVGGAADAICELLAVAKQRRAVPLDDLQACIIREAAVVFSTTMMAPFVPALRKRLKCVSVVVDEAGQVPEADLASIVDRAWERLILAGDDRQLPAVVSGEGCERAGFGRSLLERLRRAPDMKDIVLMLDVQFRMDPAIAAFSSQEFYAGRLRSCVQTQNPLPKTEAGRPFLGGVVICDTSGLPASRKPALGFTTNSSLLRSAEYLPKDSPSYANDIEVSLIKQKLELFEKADVAGTRECWSVGVIAPYESQMQLLKKALCKWMGPQEEKSKKARISVTVGTVDSFQGSESDIIILSTVRSNKRGDIGFLASERRLNVAFTRARFGLWIYCNVMTLAKKPGTVWWKFLTQFVVEKSIPVFKFSDAFATVPAMSDAKEIRSGTRTTPKRGSLRQKCDSAEAHDLENIEAAMGGLSLAEAAGTPLLAQAADGGPGKTAAGKSKNGSISLTCTECASTFRFGAMDLYAGRGWRLPIRCKPCRPGRKGVLFEC